VTSLDRPRVIRQAAFPQRHRRPTRLQGHLHQRPTLRGLHRVIAEGGRHIQGTDQDAAQAGVPSVGDLLALQQLKGQGPGAAVLINLHG